jgi:catechol 2,3-dioxygenase-like lactoylglutathione lyase family enzyme
MQVEQVDFVTVPTRDVTRAVEFYRDVLGLAPGADGEVETPNVTLSFWSPERDGESFSPNVAGVGFRVRNVKEACDELKAAGGEVVGIEDTGVCHMGFCKDLDGNTIILHRRYAPRDAR